VEAAGRALGTQRADSGVTLEETRDDVLVAAKVFEADRFRAAGLLDAATVGWIDRYLQQVYTILSCVDPLTQLTPLTYLAARIDELHAEADLLGFRAADHRGLVLVSSAPAADPISRETQMITIQVALRSAFPGGDTLSRVGMRTASALTTREPRRLHDALTRLDLELDIAKSEGRLSDIQIWFEPLPRSGEDLVQMLCGSA
jgi:hypothetical protein